MTVGTIRLLYFAWLRERVGTAEESVVPPPGIATVAALTGWLASRGAGFAAAFTPDSRIRCAVNQEFAGPDTAVSPGDEVAFFPPVTGG